MINHSGTPRIIESELTNANTGSVAWSPVKSLWYLSHTLIFLAGGFIFFSWSAVLIFVVFTSITLCLGHSLGMHRRLIHNSYQCPIWLEYVFVHFGVLVGMAGPIGMTHQHDLRDWAQRKTSCHPYLRHGKSFFHDAWWQLNCELQLDHPPEFSPEARIKNDSVFKWMEKTWMLQQLPWAILLYVLGGMPWAVWGICGRVCVSVTGHWLIGYLAHNQGHRDWHVNGAAVQGHNVQFAAYLTMGESWHNNHHAFPGSALLGIYPSQPDPGWWVLNALHNLGLVWNIVLPEQLPDRPELQSLTHQKSSSSNFKALKPCRILGLVNGY